MHFDLFHNCRYIAQHVSFNLVAWWRCSLSSFTPAVPRVINTIRSPHGPYSRQLGRVSYVAPAHNIYDVLLCTFNRALASFL